MGTTLTNERTDVLTDDYLDRGEKSSVPNTRTPGDKGGFVAVEGVRLHGNAWWKLGEVAEKRGIHIADLIAYIAESAVAEPVRRPERDTYGRAATPIERRKMTPRRLARLRELHGLGLSDGEIANHIGLSGESVRQWRNQLQLPAIPRNGPRAKKASDRG